MGKVDDRLDEKLQLLLTPSARPLTFEVLEDGTFSFSWDGLSYSLDYGTTWTTLSAGGSTPTIPAGSKVLWKGNYKAIDEDENFGQFSSTGKFNVSGNVMSLMYGDDFKDKTDLTGSGFCFNSLFYECSKLVYASDLVLPATTLAESCYSSMFNGCSNLNYIKAMFTTVPSSTYTSNWVNGVPSTGTFVKNAAATWDVTGTSGVPTGWAVETATA